MGESKLNSPEINRIIAERSLEWRDDTKLSFLWDEELVIAYVNKEYKQWRIITDVVPDKSQVINKWLTSYFGSLEEEPEE